jgi:hypothetical protein
MPNATTETPKAFIGFCPELKLYRYAIHRGSGENELVDEKRFTADELVASLVALEKEGKVVERDYLTFVTALARKQPHVRIEVQTAPGK